MSRSHDLRQWYKRFARNLPWRSTQDAYPIWLSEIILQQTRVSQGLPYFERFLHTFPTVHDLANAELDEVLKLWEGLGYYSRARNLHKGAKYISENGVPKNYESWLKVPGVGPYTAAAVSSFAFDENVAVVDGNVQRVLARLYHINEPVNSSSGQKLVQSYADELIKDEPAAEHNQAIMELGALVCTPKKPKCEECPFTSYCLARAANAQSELPIKLKKTKVKKVELNYTAVYGKTGMYVQQRPTIGIWGGLYEIHPLSPEEIELPKASSIYSSTYKVEHLLSHRKLQITIKKVELKGEEPREISGLKHSTWKEVDQLAFPKPIRAWLDEKLLPLHDTFEG